MKYMYYAIFNINDDCIDISFPDLKGCFTFGENLEDALKMSKEALEGYLLTLEDEKMTIPKASNFHDLLNNLKDNEQLQLIQVDTDFLRRVEENKSVNKMVTLPKWLVELGKERKLNFSQVLQTALKKELNL